MSLREALDALRENLAKAKCRLKSALRRMIDGHRIVVRNKWRVTDRRTQRKISFDGIAIWRIADGKLPERCGRI